MKHPFTDIVSHFVANKADYKTFCASGQLPAGLAEPKFPPKACLPDWKDALKSNDHDKIDALIRYEWGGDHGANPQFVHVGHGFP